MSVGHEHIFMDSYGGWKLEKTDMARDAQSLYDGLISENGFDFKTGTSAMDKLMWI